MNLTTVRKYFLFIIVLFTVSFSQAQRDSSTKDFTYTIQPLLGFETVYRSAPRPHTVTQTMYGLRLTGGIDLLSGEIEYTQSTGSEIFQTAPEKIVSTDEKLKIGARSLFRLSDIFNMTVRFGGQVKKTKEETTNIGVVTTEQKPIEYSPYLGAAFGMHIGKMNVSVGTTVVINDMNNMEKNEIQNTVAIGFGI
ncbi:MAG: hypothetical protein H7235_00830 [Bdellovibrionaceae bacterium]|nr:hypothetical protein [Pseudobdellovibrionaceae bacterium]